MIQRFSMRVIELERRDGDGAVAHGGQIRIRLDAINELLLVQPKIFAATRIGARLQQSFA